MKTVQTRERHGKSGAHGGQPSGILPHLRRTADASRWCRHSSITAGAAEVGEFVGPAPHDGCSYVCLQDLVVAADVCWMRLTDSCTDPIEGYFEISETAAFRGVMSYTPETKQVAIQVRMADSLRVDRRTVPELLAQANADFDLAVAELDEEAGLLMIRGRQEFDRCDTDWRIGLARLFGEVRGLLGLALLWETIEDSGGHACLIPLEA